MRARLRRAILYTGVLFTRSPPRWTMVQFWAKRRCQCWRPEGIEFFKEHVENRFFRDEEANISVSYVQVFGTLPVHGYWPVRSGTGGEREEGESV